MLVTATTISKKSMDLVTLYSIRLMGVENPRERPPQKIMASSWEEVERTKSRRLQIPPTRATHMPALLQMMMTMAQGSLILMGTRLKLILLHQIQDLKIKAETPWVIMFRLFTTWITHPYLATMSLNWG